MTQEEKAKAYDIALDKIKMLLGTGSSISREELEYVFSELKESEDERIRKEIISAIKEDWPGHEDWIAWLEKQGEQKPVVPKFNVGDVIQNKKTNEVFTISNYSLAYEYYHDINHKYEVRFSEQDDWELVEGNPAFEMKTPEESLGIDSDTYNKIVDECIYGDDKPTWSEEDEKMIDAIYSCVDSHYNGLAKDALLIWLKSLKDRVQPKQEWSEEDEKHLEGCLQYFGTITKNSIFYKDYLWLKSLRPQSHWKPSEGQLECLGYAIEKAEKDWSPLTNNRIYLTLKALKEQLLELRGSKV